MELHPFFQEKFRFMENFPFKYRPWISRGVAVMAGVGLMVLYFKPGFSPSNYVQAESLFVQWKEGSENETIFQEMKKALHKVPALEKKYEPAIVQRLIETGKGLEALEMAESSLSRIREEAPFHAAFAETSLLIETGAYQEALQKSVGLKEKMSNEWDLKSFTQEELVEGSVLYAHNLLRIACLHQELKNGPGEISGWNDLEDFLLKNEQSAVTRLILSNFEEKGINLSTYIAGRRKLLS